MKQIRPLKTLSETIGWMVHQKEDVACPLRGGARVTWIAGTQRLEFSRCGEFEERELGVFAECARKSGVMIKAKEAVVKEEGAWSVARWWLKFEMVTVDGEPVTTTTTTPTTTTSMKSVNVAGSDGDGDEKRTRAKAEAQLALW